MTTTILDPNVLLIMETERVEGNDQIKFTENNTIEPIDYVVAIQYLVGRISTLGRIPYNEVLEDLKQPEEEKVLSYSDKQPEEDTAEPTEANIGDNTEEDSYEYEEQHNSI